MNILYIVSGINSLGGIESFCKSVIPLIDRSEFRIDILITQDEPVGEMDRIYGDVGCKIYRLDGPGNVFSRIKQKKQFFKQLGAEYDIVHIHTVLTTAYYFAKLARKYTKAKVIVHSHTANHYEGAKFKNNLCRGQLNRYTDCRVACSKNAAQFLFGERQAQKAEIIYNPVDIDAFRFNPDVRESVRKNLGLSPDEIVFLHVGRLTPAKNHSFLLRVFSEIHKRKPDTKLLLCGEGDLRGPIEQQIEELQLTGSAMLLGNRHDVNEIMSASDCFVFPSLYEGLPTVLIEAQANGLPVACSDRITEEVIIDKGTGQLQIDSVDPWVDAVLKLTEQRGRIQCDSEILEKISSSFGKCNIAKHLSQTYREIVHGKPADKK